MSVFRVKRARSVVHSTAHHAVSALSWLHPKLGAESKAQGVTEVTYEFLTSTITTENFTASQETKKALLALQLTFERIGASENIFLAQLDSAFITFGFPNGRWPNYCLCSVTSKAGKTVKVKVDTFGNRYSLLSTVRDCT